VRLTPRALARASPLW